MEPTENEYHLLEKTALFAGFSRQQLAQLLAFLVPVIREYQKSECLLQAGSGHTAIGIVLRGAIEAVKYTRGGAQLMVMQAGPGGVFGDVLSGSRYKSPVTVRTPGGCRVMLVPTPRLFTPAAGQHALYNRLLANLVGVISDKYFALNARLDLLLIRGLRRRLAAFLLDAAGPNGAAPFSLPYTRTQLATILGCERSALSREVSAMARAGLITADGRVFSLPNPAALRALF